MASKRFADLANLKALFAGLKTKYEPKDSAIVKDAGYVHTDSNFTAAEKTKLEGIESGAQANVITDVKLGGTSLTPSSGAVNIPMDTGLSATSTNPVQNCIVSRPILSLMGRMGVLTDTVPDDWSELVSSIASGDGDAVIPVGTQIVSPMTDQRTNNSTVYDTAWNVMHHGTAELENGTSKNVAFLQMDRCLPYDTQFSPYQAFLYAVDGLPAGTYYVSTSTTFGGLAAGSYQFTLTQDLPAGGQLTGFYAYTGKTVYAYASQTTATATETATVTSGDDGTYLGEFTSAGVPVPASGTPETTSSVEVGGVTYRFYGLNSLHRVAYGNNRWLHSPLRQFLNSTGSNWWVPKTVFDRPPAYVSYDGFLTGLDTDFVDAMVPVKTVTALNYITDGGTSANPEYDTTYDKVFLPSGRNHYLQDTSTYGGGKAQEGDFWDYWKRVAGTASPLAWGQYHPEYIQYDLASPTTPRFCWMRSAFRGCGYVVACVGAGGNCAGNSASIGGRAAAACAISQIQ